MSAKTAGRGLTPTPLPGSQMDRLYSQLALVGECWEWQGVRGHVGHGRFDHGRPGTRLVHRLVWEDLRGPIPDGLELDHLCRNPPCANPDHLEPVTHAVNMARSIKSFVGGRETCDQGHPLTPDNVATWGAPRSSGGRRRCRQCRNEWKREWRARRRVQGLSTH